MLNDISCKITISEKQQVVIWVRYSLPLAYPLLGGTMVIMRIKTMTTMRRTSKM